MPQHKTLCSTESAVWPFLGPQKYLHCTDLTSTALSEKLPIPVFFSIRSGKQGRGTGSHIRKISYDKERGQSQLKD
jgi:hypothetical protein